MALPNSGSLSFTQIVNEFGNRGSLGSYRVNQDIGERNWPLDEGFPTSGSVSFSTFRGKRRNIVVDCYSSGGSRVSASSRGRTTVGGGPTSTSGSRIIIYINETFTSDSTQSRNRCALRTGSFDSAAKMDIIMGNSGKIYGGGGNGGNGGNAGEENANSGNSGQPGTSALGLQRSVEEIVLSGGSLIRAGSGGGGGGGGAAGELNNSEEYGGGGGGAGGAGSPAGSGGSKGNSAEEVDDYGNNGGGGSTNDGGGGGEGATGGEEENNADGGGGGGGGSWGGNAGSGGESGNGTGEANDGNSGSTSGTGGSGGRGGARGNGQEQKDGGNGGASGYSITSNTSIPGVSGGTVQGPTGANQGVS